MKKKKKLAAAMFTPEERQMMVDAMTTDVDQEQLDKARSVASILADDEDSPEDAFLALTFYYSAKENEEELNSILDSMRLS